MFLSINFLLMFQQCRKSYLPGHSACFGSFHVAISPDLRRSTLAVVMQICENPLMGSVPLFKTSLRALPHLALSFFSVEEGGTCSRLCSVNWMVSFWIISGHLSTADINGQESSQRSVILPGGSLTGWYQEVTSTSQRTSKWSEKPSEYQQIHAQKSLRIPFKFRIFRE